MYKIISFDDNSCDKYGNGASEKVWLVNNKTKQKGLFKFPKI